VTKLEKGVFSKSGLVSIKIPAGVKEMGGQQFFGCLSLTSVTLPRISVIGNETFRGCKALKQITIPDSVMELGGNVFAESGLVELILPNSIVSAGAGLCTGCWNLTKVNVSSGMTVIGDASFRECLTLTNVSIPEGVQKIGEFAFAFCHKLHHIHCPDSLTDIGRGGFSNSESLHAISLGSWIYFICPCALNHTNVTVVHLRGERASSAICKVLDYPGFPHSKDGEIFVDPACKGGEMVCGRKVKPFPTPKPDHHGKLSKGAIAGISAGAAGVLVTSIIVVIVIMKRKGDGGEAVLLTEEERAAQVRYVDHRT
jgi:hypothetical protein